VKLVGINFDHMHMPTLLEHAQRHPDVEVVGVCDERPERMAATVADLSLPATSVFTDYAECLERTAPDIAVLCSATATHGEWVERIAPFGVNVLVEKPFAASLAEADAMVEAMAATGKQLVINWPLAWRPSHLTAKRVIDEGTIGNVTEVHYYNGNRGPLVGRSDDPASMERAEQRKQDTWWYQRATGGGSLLDYLGYGVTLGTWFLDGAKPIEMTTMIDEPSDVEVDEHSVSVARYATGLSKFETRWGTFTDPWLDQPQPKCGFVIVGTAGTISSYDYDTTIRIQTRSAPQGVVVEADELLPPFQDPIQNFVSSLRTGDPIHAPLSVEIGRIGQQMVDTALLGARRKQTVPLVE